MNSKIANIGYALSINVSTESIVEFIKNANAKKKIEVVLTIDGEMKEMTFKEFKEKLGFS